MPGLLPRLRQSAGRQAPMICQIQSPQPLAQANSTLVGQRQTGRDLAEGLPEFMVYEYGLGFRA